MSSTGSVKPPRGRGRPPVERRVEILAIRLAKPDLRRLARAALNLTASHEATRDDSTATAPVAEASDG
jgi:hypothetical protein